MNDGFSVFCAPPSKHRPYSPTLRLQLTPIRKLCLQAMISIPNLITETSQYVLRGPWITWSRQTKAPPHAAISF